MKLPRRRRDQELNERVARAERETTAIVKRMDIVEERLGIQREAALEKRRRLESA